MSALQDWLFAFGVRNELSRGVTLEQPDELSFAERLVNDAAPLPERHLAIELLLQVGPEVFVGGEEDLSIRGNGLDDLLGVRRCADVVALGLHRRRAIDVRDRDGPRVASAPGDESVGRTT